eukprot:m.310372 g.310372  ORF g.310372 m.310372 type:complete len:98 (+) comp51224_c0_seq1:21-314(+)
MASSFAAAGMVADEAKQKMVADMEIEVMTDMYNKLTSACHRKCINTKYKEGELTKGEAVCLDRCVAKYLDIHDRVGKKLTTMYMQDEAKQNAAASQQ